MPFQIRRLLTCESDASVGPSCNSFRARDMPRQPRTLNLVNCGTGAQDAGLSRMSSGSLMSPVRRAMSLPVLRRPTPSTLDETSADLGLLSQVERRAGEAFLDSALMDAVPDDSDDDEDTLWEAAAERISFSRMISSMRARTHERGDDLRGLWPRGSILEASGSLEDAAPDPETNTDGAVHRMLEREVANHGQNRGGEMVESEVRRLTAEQSYTMLQRHCGDAAACRPQAIRELRQHIQASEDPHLRDDALRVLNHRIDPKNIAGFSRPQLVYQSISEGCPYVGLRALAELAWTAIEMAPVTPDKREELRMLLLYNLADCTQEESGFRCINGTFQRLLAPLNGVYPGVQTLSRTPYEVVEQVSLAWREAMGRGERLDTPEHWGDFERACKQRAALYFTPEAPLYPLLQQQLQGAIAVCRDALSQ